jgi:hypothetical protein
METTTHHAAAPSVDWIGQIRATLPEAVALALIVASVVAWTVILDRVLSTLP